MSVQIEQLTATDWDEGMAFLNEVFAEHSPHDFATLLPSIYQPTDEYMACNYAIREEGKICAIVGLFPTHWQVGETRLKVGGIGGVSTHSSVRGKGYMQLLMKHCVQRMQAEDYDLSWLGGQRQRYGYFGYETCGQKIHLGLTKSSVRHVFGSIEPLRFEPLAETDTIRMEAAVALHGAQDVYNSRGGTDTFHRFLVNGYYQPHVALDSGGNMVGYLAADAAGGSVVELLGIDSSSAIDMARSWVQSREQEGARFDVSPTSFEFLQRLSAIDAGNSISASGNWQIFDWQATVQALLQVRSKAGGLANGAVVLGIEGYGSLRIRVQDEDVSCEKVADTPMVTWSPLTAMRVLFGPLPASAVVEIPTAAAALSAWCPLPLGWSRLDGV